MAARARGRTGCATSTFWRSTSNSGCRIAGLGQSAMPPKPWTPSSIADVVAAASTRRSGWMSSCGLRAFSFRRPLRRIDGLASGRARCAGPHAHRRGSVGTARRSARAFREGATGHRARPSFTKVHRKNLEILMIADPAAIDRWPCILQTVKRAGRAFRSRPFADKRTRRGAGPHSCAGEGTIWGTAGRDRAALAAGSSRHPAPASSRTRRTPHSRARGTGCCTRRRRNSTPRFWNCWQHRPARGARRWP